MTSENREIKISLFGQSLFALPMRSVDYCKHHHLRHVHLPDNAVVITTPAITIV
jgi:hypothetical protein